MNDKDRELLEQILRAGGSAAQKGFEQLVRWQFMDGITTVIGCVALLVFCTFLFTRLFKWNPDDEGVVVKGAALVVVSIAAFASICMLQGGLRDALAPEGAAVYVVLHNH